MDLLTAILVLAFLEGSILVALGGLVVLRKAGRDRRERRIRERRARCAAAIRGGEPEELRAIVRTALRRQGMLEDLLFVLHANADTARPLGALAGDAQLLARLRRKLGARRPEVRGTTALLLAHLGGPGAGTDIAALLHDPDRDVRLVACTALSRLRGAAAASQLIAALEAGELPAERLIERLGGAWALGTILDELPRRSPAARAALARALGLIGNRRAVPALVFLLRDGDLEERISAARALGPSPAREAIPVLVKALHDPAWQVRVQAARALGAPVAASHASEVAALLADEAWWCRSAAAESLAAMGEVGLRILRRAASSHPDRYARERASEQLELHAVAHEADARPRLEAA